MPGPVRSRLAQLASWSVAFAPFCIAWIAYAFGGIGPLLAYFSSFAGDYAGGRSASISIQKPVLALLAFFTLLKVITEPKQLLDEFTVFVGLGIVLFFLSREEYGSVWRRLLDPGHPIRVHGADLAHLELPPTVDADVHFDAPTPGPRATFLAEWRLLPGDRVLRPAPLALAGPLRGRRAHRGEHPARIEGGGRRQVLFSRQAGRRGLPVSPAGRHACRASQDITGIRTDSTT